MMGTSTNLVYPDTTWLDGLRGFASLGVCFSHIVGAIQPSLLFAYGEGSEPGRNSLWKLPFIRLIYSGNAMVGIFFVISGYVLSHRPLQRGMSSSDLFVKKLASSVLRRSGRLIVPAIMSSLISMILAQFGAFDQPFPSTVMFSITATSCPTWGAQISRWSQEMKGLLKPWSSDLEVPDLLYGSQLWTIPVELWCSFILYLYILALGPVRSAPRRLLLALSQAYYMFYGRWDVFLFLAGMLVANLHQSASQSQSTVLPISWVSGDKNKRMPPILHNIAMISLLAVGLGLLSQPDLPSLPDIVIETTEPGDDSVSYSNSISTEISQAEERGRVFIAIGSSMVVYALGAGPPALRWIFETRLAQHLGRISFSLYLIHNMAIRNLGAWLLYGSWKSDKIDGGFWKILVSVVIVVISLLVANLFNWLVDKPTNRRIKGFANFVLVRDDASERQHIQQTGLTL